MGNDKSYEWNSLAQKHRVLVSKNNIIGSSLIVISPYYILQNHIGSSNKSKNIPLSIYTIFHWASITKTFTGIAIMQLVEKKKIKLTDPVIKYVPELKEVHNPFGKIEKITIEQILTHSAGFRNATWPWGGDKAWHPNEPKQWEQLVAMMPYSEILFKPGSKYAYSNLAIIFLARIIEKVTKSSYTAYIRKNILTPLKMDETYFDITPKRLLKQRSHNYHIKEGKLIDNGADFDTGITTSNGGLNGSTGDMIRYMRFLSGQIPNEKVLKQTTLQKMFTAKMFSTQYGKLKEYIGYTFYSLKKGSDIFIGHTGSQKGFMCCMYVNPKNNKGCFMAFNTTGINSKPDTRKIMNELREKALNFIA